MGFITKIIKFLKLKRISEINVGRLIYSIDGILSNPIECNNLVCSYNPILTLTLLAEKLQELIELKNSIFKNKAIAQR